MKKIGYTLAEVLISIGIIGVMAAMVIPSITNNVQVKSNMSKLSKTVTDLENGFSTAIATERTPDVFTLSFWPEINSGVGLSKQEHVLNFNRHFSKYLKYKVMNKTVQDIYDGNNFYIMNANGSQGGLWDDCNSQGTCRFRNNYPILMPNGSIVFLQLIPQGANGGRSLTQTNDGNYITESEARKRGTSLRCETGWAFIDVNGSEAPNTLGRDIFAFVIGQNGHLYPYGGSDYANFEKGKINSYNWKNNNGDYSCTNSKKKLGGLACTGRVVEEGYKMTY